MDNKKQIIIASISLTAIILVGILIFYKSSSRGEEVKSISSTISNVQSIVSSFLSQSSSSEVLSSVILSSSHVSTLSKIESEKPIVKEQINNIEQKSDKVNTCELKPDNYTDIIDLDNDCLPFSSRSMCDFDNNEPEVKELKPQLYKESVKLYNKYRSKIVSKYSLVVMSCQYVY